MKRLLPSYPLFVKDPYFQIWSNSDILTETNTVSWYGGEKNVYGFIKVDGEIFSFLGFKKGIKPLKQTNINITAFSTNYKFEHEKFTLLVKFISPLPLEDLKLLSMPVCFMAYEVEAKEEVAVSVYLVVHENIAYDNKVNNYIRTDVVKQTNYEVAYLGLDKQNLLSESVDTKGADWGYYFVVGEKANSFNESFFNLFLADNDITSLDKEEPIYIGSANYHYETREVKDKLIIAFDDVLSIYYYGEFLKGYYLQNNTIFEAIEEGYQRFNEIEAVCQTFDDTLQQQTKPYGNEYLHILYASLRQSIAGHKLVQDKKGRLLFLSKENGSDGCIATVDVTYPSAPLYLLFNPDLVAGMLIPIFDFAKMPVWHYSFAPHDAGVYPYCLGQFYGVNDKKGKYQKKITYNEFDFGLLPKYHLYPQNLNLYDFDKQMPVEECGNMLILCALINKVSNKTDFIKTYFQQLEIWAQYLVNTNVFPFNQLCTDDFAGHLDKNVNLAIKGVIGIGSFGLICQSLGQQEKANLYLKEAQKRTKIIESKATNNVLPLSLVGGSFSLKYNLIMDELLGLNLFSEALKEAELDLYLTKLNEYGVPLDSRADYTKSDWLMWSTLLTKDINKQQKIIRTLKNFLVNGEDRIPFNDWYDTVTGKAIRYDDNLVFVNRTVVGGHFILLLKDKLTNK